MARRKDERPTVNWKQASQLLGCGKTWVYHLVNTGELEAFRNGRKKGIRIYKDSVQKYIRKQELVLDF